MIRSILPKKADGKIRFGLSDPSHTGYVLAIFYLFYPENRGKMWIEPDFDQWIFEGKGKIRGRICLILLLYYILCILLDRRIFRLIRLLLKLRKQRKTADNSGDKDKDTDMSLDKGIME